jgi:pyrimidine-nucleoside phosphorylase
MLGEKQAGRVHGSEEIDALLSGFAAGSVTDPQMSAWLMAAACRGLTDGELAALTRALAKSPPLLERSAFSQTVVEQHSMSGIGDKLTLTVLPIVAAAGIRILKASRSGGRYTAGTLAKLSQIPGMELTLDTANIERLLRQVGGCICIEPDDFVPVDRKLYPLREQIGLKKWLPFMAASILCKKIASGTGGIVMDIKVGSGSLLKNQEDAAFLAERMIQIGEACGLKLVVAISDMDTPLGRAVGEYRELVEVCELLRSPSRADTRLREATCTIAGYCLFVCGAAADANEGYTRALALVEQGFAFEKLCQIVEGQGGDPAHLRKLGTEDSEHLDCLISAPKQGFVTGINADMIGKVSLMLNRRGQTKGENVSPGERLRTDLLMHAEVGQAVSIGTPLASLDVEHTEASEPLKALLCSAFHIGETFVSPSPPILSYRYTRSVKEHAGVANR